MAGAHVKRTTQGFKGTGTSSTNPHTAPWKVGLSFASQHFSVLPNNLSSSGKKQPKKT